MKKGLVVLLILAMTGAAFAQEVKISGEVQTGLLFEQQGDGDLTVRSHVDNIPLDATRAQVQADVGFGNYGARVRLRADLAPGAGLPPFQPNQAYVWGNFVNDILTVTAGKFGGAWHTEGDFDSDYDGLPGIRFEIKPIDGLNFGFALDGTNFAAPSADPQLKVGDFLKETVFGVKYKNDLFSLVLALKLDSDDGPSDEETKFLYSVKVAPGAITFVADGQFYNLSSDNIQFNANQNLKFQVSDPFEVHLAAAEEGGLGDDADITIDLTPGLSYGITDAVTLKANVGFGFSTADDSAVQISIKPGLEYVLGEKAKINTFYKATINPGYVEEDLKNEVQVDFIWSF